jgi:Cu/Zn superoxide dismutase
MVGVNSTRFTLRVKGIDADAGHGTFGAHLHMGPCVEGDWDGTLGGKGHYNTDILASVIPPDISPQTEVWLDFDANSDGEATIRVTVPFIPDEGERSIVIHDQATDPVTGLAGPRLACLPLEIQQIG